MNKLPHDVIVGEDEEICQGFSHSNVQSQKPKAERLKQTIKDMEQALREEQNGNFHGFSSLEVEKANDRREKLSDIIEETSFLVNKIRKAKMIKKTRPTYAWDYQHWLEILESDDFDEDISNKQTVRANQVDGLIFFLRRCCRRHGSKYD